MKSEEYKLKRSIRARRLTISVKNNGEVVVTVPFFIASSFAHQFAKQKWPWVEKARRKIAARPEWEKIKLTKKDYILKKKDAENLVRMRLQYFFNISKELQLNIPVWENITIRNQKSRWGSCSKKRNLNFNYRILYLPIELQDYIVVHELCHLKELNHSKRFWNLVSLFLPDFTKRKKLLAGNIN